MSWAPGRMRVQPGKDLLRVLVRREDRVEGVLDQAVPDHEREPPEQGHPTGLERPQAQPLGQAQRQYATPTVAQMACGHRAGAASRRRGRRGDRAPASQVVIHRGPVTPSVWLVGEPGRAHDGPADLAAGQHLLHACHVGVALAEESVQDRVDHASFQDVDLGPRRVKGDAMSTRDRIMDGAVEVMRTRGLANTTTKEIARAAGLSEAMLYKVFRDKVDLFLGVLTERLPRVAVLSEEPEGRVGRGTVRAELRRLVSELLSFHLESFPIAASVFSDPNLLGRRQELTMTTIDTEDPLAVAVTARSTPATPGPCGGCSRRAPSWRRQGSAMTTPMGCRAPCCMSRRSGLDTTRTARRPTPP